MKEVVISYSLDTILNSNEWEGLDSEDIEGLQADDACDLIQKLTSTSIKSYGGLGGLKTVSSRGLGASHSAIVSDGFSIQNTQNGQINLGQIHADNIQHIIGGTNQSISLMLPISAQISGSQFSMETFENHFGNNGLQFRILGKQGSFNQLGSYGALKYSNKKILMSAHGSHRKTNGSYPYTIQNGAQTIQDFRLNNDYQDYTWGFTSGFKGRRSVFRLGFLQKKFEQGVPGAVILYNSSADERLTSRDNNIFGDYTLKGNSTDVRVFFKLNENELHYEDPDFLNTYGGISDKYENKSLQVGANLVKKFNKQFKVNFGLEQVLSQLNVDNPSFARPIRAHNYALIGVDYQFENKMNIKLEISSQYINENNLNGTSAKNRFRVNPFLKWSSKEHQSKFKHEFWYRNSFRMPSFNELYYNNIGNTSLLPEDAHQINYGWSIYPLHSKNNQLYIRQNFYTNFVSNKIVAIPTKNLFVWSMQNVENARILGADMKIGSHWNISKNIKTMIDVNYSYQSAVDISEEGSPTYGDQIAYIPIHTGNIDLSFLYKSMGIRFSNYTNSSRYALNENIEGNKVNGFIISTLSTFYTWNIKQSHIITLRFTIKNLFNESYAFVRSFVMPQRNYLIVLKYAFN
jgi:hypothetical protein